MLYLQNNPEYFLLQAALKYFLFFIIINSGWAQQTGIDSLLRLLPNAAGDTNKVNILNALSNESIGISDFKKAISYANEAKTLSEKLDFKKGLAAAYHYLGNAFYYQSDYSGSLVFYLRCYAVKERWLAENLNDLNIKQSLADACNDLGYVYDYLSDYPKALHFYLKCLKISEEIDYKKGIAVSTANIANIYDYKGEYDKAIEFNLKALKQNQELDRKRGIANAYNNIGNAYYKKYDFIRSYQFHKLGLKIKQQLDDEMAVAISYKNLGSLFIEFHDQPIDTLRKCFPEYQKISLALIKKHLLDSARIYLLDALKTCEKENSGYGIIQIKKSLGDASFKEGGFQEALRYHLEAITLSEELKTQKELFESYRTVAEIYNQLGKHSEAYHYQKLYSELKDTVFNEIKEKDLGKQEASFEYEKELLAKEKEQEKRNAIAAEEKRQQNIIITSVGSVAGLLMIFVIFIFRSYRQKQKANVEIIRQKVIIEEKNREVFDSISYAKRIQNAILPPEKLVKSSLPDSFILFKPKDIVSGDFYWMENIGNQVLFAAVDCTGHGVPGAMVSVVGHNGLNRCVKEFRLSQPAGILDKLTELVEETFSKSESEGKDGMDMSLCSLNKLTNVLEWSGANNPIWLFREGKMESIKADKQPVGLHISRQPFTNHIVQLSKGDSLYIFTDGYADQFGGEKGKKFKYKQLEDLLSGSQHLSMPEQKSILEATFIKWKGNLEQVDDVCIIGVRIPV